MIRLTGAKGMKITVVGEKMRESSCFPNSTLSGCIAENTLKKSWKNFENDIDPPFAVSNILQLKLRNTKHLAEINLLRQIINRMHFKGGSNYGR